MALFTPPWCTLSGRRSTGRQWEGVYPGWCGGWVPGWYTGYCHPGTQPARLRLIYGYLEINRFIRPFESLISVYLSISQYLSDIVLILVLDLVLDLVLELGS